MRALGLSSAETDARFRTYGSDYSKRFIASTAGGRPYLYIHQIRRDHPLL